MGGSEAARFAFLTTFYPPHNFGGDGVGIQRLARGLVRAGHRVDVIYDADAYTLLSPKPPSEPPREPEGLRTIPLSSRSPALSCLLTQQLGRPVVKGRAIARLLGEGAYDVVNFHNVSLIGGPGLLSYAPEAVKLYMAHEHWLVCPTHVLWKYGKERCDEKDCLRCTLSHRRPPQAWRYTGFLERQVEHVDAFIAMSEFSRQKHREFGFPRDMEVLPYFLPDPEHDEPDPQDAVSPHERPYFLFVGRLERIKGLDDVIPLFRAFGEADLLIAGDGEYAETLKGLAADVPRVRFLGRVPLEQLRRYYRHALALVVPSVCYETFGIISIEAFRWGAPVIARRVGPLPEVVEGCGGGMCFDTPEELRALMARFVAEPELRDRHAEAGHRAFLERWVESAVIPRYLEVVERARAHRDARRARAQETITA